MTLVAASVTSRLRKRDTCALVGLLAVAVVLPTVVGAISGSLDIPRNDDWSYRNIALHLFQTGRLEIDGSASAMLVGQILVAQPFLWLSGGATWGLTVVGVLSAVIAIVAGYLLVRRLVTPGRAALAMLLLPLFPGFLPYASSFMTDLPAIGAEFVCLGLGIAALAGGRIRGRWLLASLAVGVFGFSVREFALAAPASVLAAAVLAQPRRLTPWLSGFAVLASCVAIYYLRSHLPNQGGSRVLLISDYSLDRAARAVSSLAFVLLPAAIVAAAIWWRHWRLPDVAMGAVLGSYLVHERVFDLATTGVVPPVLLDNLPSQWGTPYQYMTFGIRPLLFSDMAWSAINGLALIATIVVFAVGAGVLGFHVRRALRAPRSIPIRLASPAGIVLMFSVATALGLIVYWLIGSIFDRYLWPLVPTLAGLMLMRPLGQERGVEFDQPSVEIHSGRPSGGARPVGVIPVVTTAALILVLGGMGLSLMLNSDAFDSARWSAGERLVDLGIPAESIDAGYEWVGYHATGPAGTDLVPAATWYEEMWPSFRLCGFVSTVQQDVPGAQPLEIDFHAYRLLLFAGPDEWLYLYRVAGPQCGTASS
jgi:hypothetical protein